jgi:hypothetical protein
MPETLDPRSRVTQVTQKQGPFHHVCAGIHIGAVVPQPKAGEFDSVLTIAAEPRSVDDSIRHRHIPINYQTPDRAALDQAVEWVYAQFFADRTVLIRSEAGKQRPGLVAAVTLVQMGATFHDALACVRVANPAALTDFRYLNTLRLYTDAPGGGPSGA